MSFPPPLAPLSLVLNWFHAPPNNNNAVKVSSAPDAI
jgi:hypothetical protein